MNEARDARRCATCKRTPILARRQDSGRWRALAWCEYCGRVAFGGDSFAPLPAEFVDLLPVAQEKQGSLL